MCLEVTVTSAKCREHKPGLYVGGSVEQAGQLPELRVEVLISGSRARTSQALKYPSGQKQPGCLGLQVVFLWKL